MIEKKLKKKILTHEKIVWIDAFFFKSAKWQDDHEIAIVTKSVRIIDRRFAIFTTLLISIERKLKLYSKHIFVKKD